MIELNNFHDQAMDLVFMARIERRRGNTQQATEMFEQALDLELDAVKSLDGVMEPTYSVLRRSAGWIAVDCGNFRLAERLACEALAKEPPPWVATELRNLLDYAMLSLRLQPEDVVLQDGDVELCLAGNSISSQYAPFSDVYVRADSFQKMYLRVAQWRNALEYSRHIPSWIRQQYPLFVSSRRLDAHGVSFRTGKLGSQLGLLATPEPSQVVESMVNVFGAVNYAGVKGLSEEGLNGDYRNSIAGLVKQIAPDGARVRRVGVVVASGKDTRVVSLERPASDIQVLDRVTPGSTREVRGMLRVADAHNESRNIVTIYPIGGEPSVRFHVPNAWMDDVVPHMWNTYVFASGVYGPGRNAELQLVDIYEADPVDEQDIGVHMTSSVGQGALPNMTLSSESGGLRLWYGLPE